MAYKKLTSLIVTCFILCYANVVHAQYDIPDIVDMNTTNILDLFDNFDIQKYIRDMQNGGSLENIAQLVVGIGTSDYSISTKCMKDFFTAAQGISNFEMWALQMIDAIGKPHTGILSDFDITWDGSYDECKDLKAITYSNATIQSDPIHHFDGKYCKVGLPIPGSLTSLNPFIGSISGGNIKVGVCIPDSCDTGDMKNIMLQIARTVFNASEEYEPDAVCHDGLPIETKTIVAICVLSLFGIIVVIGTLYDIYLRLSETSTTKDEIKEKPESKIPQTNGHVNGGLNGDVKLDLSTANDEKANEVVDDKPTITDRDVNGLKQFSNSSNAVTQIAETPSKTIFLQRSNSKSVVRHAKSDHLGIPKSKYLKKRFGPAEVYP